jgi:hypothetical protein
MSTYDERVAGMGKFGPAASRLVPAHKALFQTAISEKDTFEKIVALIRLRDTIELPANDEEAYGILESLLAELLFDGRIKMPAHGLGQDGRESFDYLVALHQNPNPTPKTPAEQFADVITLYRTDMKTFIERRAQDPEFLRRSDEANALHLF